ncbi:MAG TPA: hypothetical protein ENH82_05055 [bacterium]|nr:hypothetical protein [bacterium]
MENYLTELAIYIHELNNKMFAQLELEAHKGINRSIAIIRSYGREFDNKYKDDPTVKQGGFVQFTKKRMLELKANDRIKAALKYL